MPISSPAAEDRPAGFAPSRREFVVGGALISAAVVAGLLKQRSDLDETASGLQLEDIVPQRIGRWERSAAGDMLIPKGEAPEDEAYDDVLTRHYVDGAGNAIMFLAAYGSAQSGNTQIHRPEACYPAAGFELSNRRETSLRSADGPIDALALTARAPGRTEQILYWSRIGRQFPISSAGQRWAAFRQSLAGATPDGVLVRISTISPDLDAALPALRGFAAALLATPDPNLQQLLTGSA